MLPDQQLLITQLITLWVVLDPISHLSLFMAADHGPAAFGPGSQSGAERHCHLAQPAPDLRAASNASICGRPRPKRSRTGPYLWGSQGAPS